MTLVALLLGQDPTLLPPLRELGAPPQYAVAPLEPRAVAFGKDGRIYVADAGAHRILVFAADGKEAGGWGGSSELLEPSGVAVGPDGEVFVADTGNGRIRIFDPEGRFLFQWGGLSAPRHVSRYGDRVYVTETDKHRVRVFGLRGEAGPTIEGGLNRPGGAAADEEGTVYVADSGNHRIRTFTRDGAALGGWGSWGQPSTFLARPGAVAWHAGHLVVADTGNHRVQVFDPQGRLLRQWGAPPSRPGQGGGHLHGPAHVAVSPDGVWAAVAEPVERRAQVFAYRDAPAGQPWYGPPWWDKMHARQALADPSAPKPPGLSVLAALADRESHSVFFVDVTENTVSRIVARAGGFGVRLGLFNDPVAVAFDAKSRQAWVSDAGNRRVQLLTLGKGSDVRAVAAWDFPSVPGPMALDGRGRLLVLDAAGSALEILDTKDLSRVRVLRAPAGARWDAVAADASRVVVADGLGARVQVLDEHGAIVASWGRRGSEPGDLLRPSGVAVDGAGQVHVVDALLEDGRTYDAAGRFLRRWGSAGLRFRGAASLAFGRPDHLLVDNAGQHMGLVFTTDGRNAGFFLESGHSRDRRTSMIRAAAPLFALALLSCGGPAPAEALRFESARGGYAVTFVPSPSPIPLNQPFEATIRVEPRKPAAGPLTVEVDARMPEHFHGMNRVAKTARQADGTFKTEGLLFHMPGRWELYVDIADGGKTERAQVEVILK